jgi:hypothetical protein
MTTCVTCRRYTGRRPTRDQPSEAATLELADDLNDFLGQTHAAAICFHVEDERLGLRLHRVLHAAPDDIHPFRRQSLCVGERQPTKQPPWHSAEVREAGLV